MEFVKKITHASLWQVFYLCTYFVSQKYWLEAVGSFLPTAVKRSRMCWLGSENLGAASFALIFLNLLLCSILNCWKTAKHWLQPASLAASIPTKPPAFKFVEWENFEAGRLTLFWFSSILFFADEVPNVHWLQLSGWQLLARLKRVGFIWVGLGWGPRQGVWYNSNHMCTLFPGLTNSQESSLMKINLIDKMDREA